MTRIQLIRLAAVVIVSLLARSLVTETPAKETATQTARRTLVLK